MTVTAFSDAFDSLWLDLHLAAMTKADAYGFLKMGHWPWTRAESSGWGPGMPFLPMRRPGPGRFTGLSTPG